MRGAALIGTGVVAAAIVLGFTVLGSSPARAGTPSLRVVGSAPLEIRGSHFRPGEHVRLIAARSTARTRANGDGYFVVMIPAADPCSTRVLARGSNGSFAVVKLMPSRQCAPAP
jgi:hypothetical protein